MHIGSCRLQDRCHCYPGEGGRICAWYKHVRLFCITKIGSPSSGRKKKNKATNSNSEVGFSSKWKYYKYTQWLAFTSFSEKAQHSQCSWHSQRCPLSSTGQKRNPAQQILDRHVPSVGAAAQSCARSGEVLRTAKACETESK